LHRPDGGLVAIGKAPWGSGDPTVTNSPAVVTIEKVLV
jgi:hypothetical protein